MATASSFFHESSLAQVSLIPSSRGVCASPSSGTQSQTHKIHDVMLWLGTKTPSTYQQESQK